MSTQTPVVKLNPVEVVAIREHFEVEPDYLKEALRIERGLTMMRATGKHLHALIQERDELLLTLESFLAIFEDHTKEIEASFGEMPVTRAQIVALRKRIEIGRAA